MIFQRKLSKRYKQLNLSLILLALMVKNLQVIENTISSSTHEGGVSYINYYYKYYSTAFVVQVNCSVSVYPGDQ